MVPGVSADAARVGLLGMPQAGKSTYLAALWQLIEEDNDHSLIEVDITGDRSYLQRLGEDLTAKANSIHWYEAWSQAFRSVGDTESADELAGILREEVAHRDALQQALNQQVLQGMTTEVPAARA